MKFKFTEDTVFLPEFGDNLKLPEGERFQVRLKSMNVQDLFQLMDIYTTNKENTKKAISEAALIISRYAVVENLEDLDGPVDIQRVLNFPAYLALAGEIMGKLTEASAPRGDEEKNSVTQPA